MRLTLHRLLANLLRFLSDFLCSGQAVVTLCFGVCLVAWGYYGYGIPLILLAIPIPMVDRSRRRNVANLIRAVRRVGTTWFAGLTEPSRIILCDLFEAADRVAEDYRLPDKDGDSR